MVFDCLLGDEKFFANFLVAKTLRDELHDFFFAIAEQGLLAARAGFRRFCKGLHDFGGHTVVEPDFAGVNAVNAFYEKVGRRLFEDDAASAEAHGADNVAIVFRSRQDDNARGNRIEIDFFEDGEAVFFRHAQVEQENVGLQLGEQLDALGAILSFANDGDVLIAINEFAEAIAKNRVIVGHENSNLLFGLRHNLSNVCLSKRQPSGTSIVRRAPWPGFDSTVRTPFTVRARSLMEMGPSRRRSNSSPVKRPAKLKPSPLSSTTKSRRLSSCESFTTTWVALACFFMLLSASR